MTDSTERLLEDLRATRMAALDAELEVYRELMQRGGSGAGAPTPTYSAKPTYSTAEVCELLGVSEGTLRRLVRRGLVPRVELGGRMARYPRAAIDRLCAEGDD